MTTHTACDHKLVPILLEENFYNGLRNVLTPERLQCLAKKSRQIPLPKIFGETLNEAHYSKTFNLLVNSTDETRLCAQFFFHQILPKLTERNNMLDVGAGDGKLIKLIGSQFNHITAIDDNLEIINTLNVNKKIARKRAQLIKIHASILDANLPNNYYNLVTLSHLLYYIERSQWLKIIQQVYNATKPGGIIMIVLSGDDLGKKHLLEYFGGQPLNIDSFTQECISYFGSSNIELFASTGKLAAADITAMLHISGFLLRDAKTIASKKDLSKYLNQYCKKTENYFELTSQQKFILVHKRIKQHESPYSLLNQQITTIA